MKPSDRKSDAGLCSRRRRFLLALSGILVLAAALRLYKLGEQDYWLDELHSLANSAARRAEFESVPHGVIFKTAERTTELTSESNLAHVWNAMTEDTHPPVYFVLLRLWRGLWGDSEFAVRSLSALFSVLSVLPFVGIFTALRRPGLGLIAALVFAMSFSHLHMAQEARPYAVAIFFLTTSYWCLVEAHSRWNRANARMQWFWILIYSAATYLTLMTHYFSALALAGQVVVAGGARDRRFRKAVAMAGLLVVLAFLLTWGPALREQWPLIQDQDWLIEQRTYPLARTLHRVLILPIRLLFDHTRFATSPFLAGLGALMVAGAITSMRRFRAQGTGVFAAWFLATMGGFLVLELVTQKRLLSHLRYGSIGGPGWVGLVVMAASPLPRSVRAGLLVGLMVVMGATLRLPTQDNPSNDRAAHLIAEHLRPGDLLIIDATDWPRLWAARMYHHIAYYLPQHLAAAPPPVVLLRDQPDDELKRAFVEYQRLIVVAPPLKQTPNPLPDQFRLLTETDYVDQVGFIYLFGRKIE